jgi:hypothetical protein
MSYGGVNKDIYNYAREKDVSDKQERIRVVIVPRIFVSI